MVHAQLQNHTFLYPILRVEASCVLRAYGLVGMAERTLRSPKDPFTWGWKVVEPMGGSQDRIFFYFLTLESTFNLTLISSNVQMSTNRHTDGPIHKPRYRSSLRLLPI